MTDATQQSKYSITILAEDLLIPYILQKNRGLTEEHLELLGQRFSHFSTLARSMPYMTYENEDLRDLFSMFSSS